MVYTGEEYGVMAMKDGKAWGIVYRNGCHVGHGWVNPAEEGAKLSDPEFCLRPEDMARKGSPEAIELDLHAELKQVTRKVVVVVEDV